MGGTRPCFQSLAQEVTPALPLRGSSLGLLWVRVGDPFSTVMQNLEMDPASSPLLLTGSFSNYSSVTSFYKSKSLKNGPFGDHGAEGQLCEHHP